MGPLVRTIQAVLDPIAEAGHGNAQLSAQAIVFVRLTSLGLALWAWGKMGRLAQLNGVQRPPGQLLTGRGGGELRLVFQTSAFFRSREASGVVRLFHVKLFLTTPNRSHTPGSRQVEGRARLSAKSPLSKGPCPLWAQHRHILYSGDSRG